MPRQSFVENRLPFRIHPRVFAALGADLVTNDVVAVLELVKNSYDAFATRVDVVFGEDAQIGRFLDIKDNGTGMDRKTLEEAWCVVATPFRHDQPTARKGNKTRRVAGEKGLGRLSAARLGKRLEMLTKSASEPCWLVEVDWTNLSAVESLENCFAGFQRFDGDLPFEDTGTRVRILSLNSDWSPDQIADLDENLARLISPFSEVQDFSIFLTAPDTESGPVSTEILAPEFLKHPPYAIRGHVTKEGDVKARYEFTPLAKGQPRKYSIVLNWPEIWEASDLAKKLKQEEFELTRKRGPKPPLCGPFSFEIRAWDIGSDDTREIAEHFDIAQGNVRKAIRAHKGISLYRDGILVLPKSEENRDWLGMDRWRISKVGTRLGTSQVVGYVSITAAENKQLEDTSDREGLARNQAVLEFQDILWAVVSVLSAQRDEDRLKPSDQVKLHALLDGVSGDELVQEVSTIAEEGGTVQEVLVRVRDFNARLELVRDALKTRFIYYSRLATIGTIAAMLVHEIRNRTTAIGRFLRSARRMWDKPREQELLEQLTQAENSLQTLEKLADTFAPLASRAFRRGRRDSVVEESIARCVALLENEIKDKEVEIDHLPSTKTRVAVDPGELDTIILNLLTNALYWVTKGDRKPKLEVVVRKSQDGKRVRVTMSDSGRGVAEEDAEKIFLPGVTRKPGGIGMGLTVAAELVSEYGGRLALVQPGKLGGATFVFDIPLKS